ncbi:MAG: hypothetical protein ACTSUS_01060 [Candidatus Freyarchaeota archaeon]|nr:hypothetical protein [Candidatus Freyrarchaeum guaymaensis]
MSIVEKLYRELQDWLNVYAGVGSNVESAFKDFLKKAEGGCRSILPC